MTALVDAVNIGSVKKRTYHHGDLRNALVEAAFELAREGGPDAVVLREASRRVGVSHNAAYRHFADRRDLLREASARSMSELARLIERRVASAARGRSGADAERERLRASGRAYVDFALAEPGLFRTAFASGRARDALAPGEGTGETGLTPFELLNERLDAFEAAGGFPPKRRERAEYAAWASVHGLATLLTDGPLSGTPPAERKRLIERVLDNVERGL